ncbi:MAG: HAD family hydrolase [Burkholderiaceae bacterium]
MQSTKPRAILFDLDGTLADTAPDLAAAVNRLRSERKLPLADFESLRQVASAGARGLIGAAFGMKPDDEGYEVLRTEFLNNYESAIAVETSLFEGVEELLAALDENGLHWGIVTNKAARFTDLLVPKIGLHRAKCVISGDTTPHSKPHPEPLFEAARRIGLAPQECWYVGDDARDIQAGHAAGMFTVAAGWGYCGESKPVTWNAHIIADTPLDILKMIP